MTVRKSGLWCDLCNKPILSEPYWNCSINGKRDCHSCDDCKNKLEAKDPEGTDLNLTEGS